MIELVYKDINEVVYFHTLENGLQIYILPKQGFHKTFVTLSTPLGSNVTTYPKNGQDIELPLGVAHFLEHKLFDRAEGDISEQFAMQGAQVNAYTMNTRTTYLFSCTEQVNQNIQTLLDFVFHPEFTEEGITKEIDIITQEIKMYEDDANTSVYMGTLKNLYHNHPIRHDILGTETSLKQINKEVLEDVHRAYYDPSQMVLFVTGNVDPFDVIQSIESHSTLPKSTYKTIPTPTIEEPQTVLYQSRQKEMDVLLPNTILGFKLKPNRDCKHPIMKQELIYSMMMDMVIGKSTENFEKLLETSLINDSFGMDITIEDDLGFILVGSQTKNPDELHKTIIDMIQDLQSSGLDKDHFERTKKQIVGGFIQALNSLEYIANQFTKYHFMGGNLFTILDVAGSITLHDIKEALDSLMQSNNQTTYTVYPKQKT